MLRNKWLRVLVLVAVGAMLLALPLAGCKKKPTAGGEQTPGGQPPGYGVVGGGGSGGSPAAVGFFKFQAGQYLKYRVSVAGATEGWFTVNITDGGSGKLKLDVAGNYAGQTFAGTVTASTDTVANDTIQGLSGNPFAMICVVPLFSIPWNQYFLDANLELGKKWSYEAPGVKVEFEVTGTQTYAGLTGSVGTWKTTSGGQTMTCSFCVNPSLPMALYVKYYATPASWLEYTLLEATGF